MAKSKVTGAAKGVHKRNFFYYMIYPYVKIFFLQVLWKGGGCRTGECSPQGTGAIRTQSPERADGCADLCFSPHPRMWYFWPGPISLITGPWLSF